MSYEVTSPSGEGQFSVSAAVAYHEAGHATLDLLFDHEVELVTIIQDGAAFGTVRCDRSVDDALRFEDDVVKQVPFERRVMSAMAGTIAQRRFNVECVYEGGDDSDLRAADEYLEELDIPNPEVRAAYVRLLQLRTEAMIEMHWPRVERIATLLLAKGTVTGEEARAAFVDPPAEGWPMV